MGFAPTFFLYARPEGLKIETKPITMDQQALSPELLEELRAVAAETGGEILDLRYAGGTLRIVLDHPSGVTLEHCARVSKQASVLLDNGDFGHQKYLLEVTSPGLDRELYGPEDYQRFVGQKVRVTHFTGVDRRKTTIVGRLVDFDAEARVAAVSDTSEVEHRIPLSDIKLARLEVEL